LKKSLFWKIYAIVFGVAFLWILYSNNQVGRYKNATNAVVLDTMNGNVIRTEIKQGE